MPPSRSCIPRPGGPEQVNADPAIDALRARIQAQSKAAADHIAVDPEAKAFIDDWAIPEPSRAAGCSGRSR